MNQRVAQAAAWHLANGLSWEELANKQIEHLVGGSEPWFSPDEIRSAMQIAADGGRPKASEDPQRNAKPARPSNRSANSDRVATDGSAVHYAARLLARFSLAQQPANFRLQLESLAGPFRPADP